MSKWKLNRTTQCAKCPWKADVNPHDIPNGYSTEKHRNLRGTIATPGEINLSCSMNVMACHESDEDYCIGWLHNQLGSGNNIALRIQMLDCENAREIRTIGKQHPNFEATLPG